MRTVGRSARTCRYGMLLLVCCIAIVSAFVDPARGEPAPAGGGVVDLRDWRIARDGPVRLSGQWEFYWGELLTPGEFQGAAGSLADVPSYWTRYGAGLPASGYATFRLRIRLPDTPGSLALYIAGEGSAYALWANGRPLGGVGVVGRDAASTVPDKRHRTYFLSGSDRELELVVQIANFNHRKAGFRNAPVLGDAEQVHRHQRLAWVLDALVIGILLWFSLEYLILFLFRREETSALYFGLLCLVVGVHAGLTNQGLLLWLAPKAAWGLLLRVEYLAFFMIPALYTGFVRSLYPQEFSRVLLRASWIVGGVFSLAVLVLPTLPASYLIPPFQWFYLAMLLLLLACLVKVVVRKREYRFYIATASLLVGALNLEELLHLAGYIPFGNLSHIGFLAFLAVQSIMLSARSADTDKRLIQVSRDLEQRNLSLEHSEQKYRELFEDSYDMIFIAAPDGRIVDVNPACEKLLGYRPEEIVRLTATKSLGTEAAHAKFAELIARDGAVVDFQTEVTHRDGYPVPVLVTASYRRDDQGRIIGLKGVIRNLSDRVEAIEQRQRAERLELIAALDPLTRTFNRRYFQEVAEQEVSRARRQRAPLTLMIFDLDYFKSVNDRFGHVAGDTVLVAVARLVQNRIRTTDVLARYGGEEFAILLRDTQLEQAHQRAESLRREVEELVTEAPSGEQITVTISLGIGQWRQDEDLTTLLERADQALYNAKTSGRNCVRSAAA